MSDVTLLLTSAGRRNQLLRAFRSAAEGIGLNLRTIAADAAPALSPACHEADVAVRVPRCDEPGYVEALREICNKYSVRLLVPTIDPELSVLAAAATDFADRGTHVFVSNASAVRIARDKQLTAEVLGAAGVPVPRTLPLAQYRREPQLLPGDVVAKPRGGSASQRIVFGQSPEDLSAAEGEDMIVQARHRGAEYTVNVYVDGAGQLRCVVPHRRIEVRGGEVAKGQTERVPEFEAAAERIVAALPGARGALCFQVIRGFGGEFVVFEINARFGGGYPLAHHAGATFTAWALQEALGMSCLAHNDWREGVVMLRYDDAIFIEP